MKKGNRGNSDRGLRRNLTRGYNLPSFLKYKNIKQYATEKNIYMALGIATAVGTLTYLAFKYVPWESIREKIEEEFDSVQQGEFSSQTVDAL